MNYPLPDKLTLPKAPVYESVPEYKDREIDPPKGIDHQTIMAIIAAGVAIVSMVIFMHSRRNRNTGLSATPARTKRVASRKASARTRGFDILMSYPTHHPETG